MAGTAVDPGCETNGPLCYKEMRIVNNTVGPLYPVIQASIQTQGIPNCPDGGDTWLQAALKDTHMCYPVKNTYYFYINPTNGIPAGKTASIKLPWYSQPTNTYADKYIDWWRAGRIYLFDDQKALNESYLVNSGANGIKIDSEPGKPWVGCATLADNVCDPADLKVYLIDGLAIKGSDIQTQTPFQLNEYTFADVDPNAVLLNLELNYNVSNVDQLYLPLAIEPIHTGFEVGWMGSIMSVKEWREKLATWTGANADQTGATLWPIYNNPIINQDTKERLYPKAGIRVPLRTHGIQLLYATVLHQR